MAEENKVPNPNNTQGGGFAEDMMRQAGKSEEEARRMGQVDRADEQVDGLFAPQYQTANSPLHRAVWDKQVPVELFRAAAVDSYAPWQKNMDAAVSVLHRRRLAGNLYDGNGKVAPETVAELGETGYWGLLIKKEFGGQGASFRSTARFITRVAAQECPTTAGMLSMHACIGAVDPLEAFGNPEQQGRLLPDLATGNKLSAFALTEPNAGSDMTALRTKAVLDGSEYVLTGTKLFISNAIPGRRVGVVCLVDGQPAVLIVDLPEKENEEFQIKRYGIHALKHAYNNGLVFNALRVPKENLLVPAKGDGLTIAYHGLNRGRVALCANAAGVMRLLLKSMIPWGRFRVTYGEPIDSRELVRIRMARVAGYIVGADALSGWGASLLDAGYRGELECVPAKIYGSEWQWETAKLAMQTHGGRSFLHGHIFGDNVHDYLAPLIYEGEGDMLCMAFFKALSTAHGKQYMKPIGDRCQETGIKKPFPFNPVHAWKFRREFGAYGAWLLGAMFNSWINAWTRNSIGGVPAELDEHVNFALDMFAKLPVRLSNLMTTYQMKLADRQQLMVDISRDVMNTVTILTACQQAVTASDPGTVDATSILCWELRSKVTGKRLGASFNKACNALAERIIEGHFTQLDGVPEEGILERYSK